MCLLTFNSSKINIIPCTWNEMQLQLLKYTENIAKHSKNFCSFNIHFMLYPLKWNFWYLWNSIHLLLLYFLLPLWFSFPNFVQGKRADSISEHDKHQERFSHSVRLFRLILFPLRSFRYPRTTTDYRTSVHFHWCLIKIAVSSSSATITNLFNLT